MKLLPILLFCLASTSVFSQEHLRGPHPQAGEEDHYLTAKSVAGYNCCHGVDCSEYFGPPPRHVTRGGKVGVEFARRVNPDGTPDWKDAWFFTYDQAVDISTLPAAVKGIPALCIGKAYTNGYSPAEPGYPRCWHFPQGG